MAHPLELVEAAQLDLELQRGAALAARQRHQEPGVAPLAPGGLDLAADELDRASAVGRQHVVREAGEVHGGAPDRPDLRRLRRDLGREARGAVAAAYRRSSGRPSRPSRGGS
jgi:hypothetical protein